MCVAVSQPPDPWNSLSMAAISLHTLYENLRSGGFTEEQALTLVAKMVVAYDAKADDDSGL